MSRLHLFGQGCIYFVKAAFFCIYFVKAAFILFRLHLFCQGCIYFVQAAFILSMLHLFCQGCIYFVKAAFIFVKARWPGRLEYREPLFLKYENEDEEMEFLDTRQVAQVSI